MNKPDYQIPSMTEIGQIPWNGLTAVSTFSGAGGGSLGLKMAGFRIAYASEFIPEAREVYNLNFPGVPVDDRDIRKVKGTEILETVGGPVDVLEGSPPCSDFSTSGKRAKGWGKEKAYSSTRQRVDDLFFEFVRIVSEVKPRVFIAENTSGLARGVSKGYLKEIHAAMTDAGYTVGAKILDAAYLGTPQHRRRLIFVGVRNDLTFPPPYPKPLPYRYSIQDACPWIADPVVFDTGGQWPGKTLHPKKDSLNTVTVGVNGSNSGHWATAHYQDGEATDPETGENIDLRRYALYKRWMRLAEGGHDQERFNLVRASRSKPANTIVAIGGSSPGTASITHPTEPRKFTIPELRRLCGFPDDFQLTGKFSQRWERLGRAVPPPLYREVGRVVAEALNE